MSRSMVTCALVAITHITGFATGRFLAEQMWAEANAFATLAAFTGTSVLLRLAFPREAL